VWSAARNALTFANASWQKQITWANRENKKSKTASDSTERRLVNQKTLLANHPISPIFLGISSFALLSIPTNRLFSVVRIR
jgi:hypothetical protein